MKIKSKPTIQSKEVLKRLNILGVPFEVVLADLEDGTYGETEGHARKIMINRNQPKNLVLSTLFHEAIHAVLHVSGHTELLTHQQEEALVIALESAFAHAIDFIKLEHKD